MNVTAMTSAVYALLDTGSANNDRLTPAMVLAMLNDEYCAVVEQTECFTRCIAIPTTAGVGEYALPGDVARISGVTCGEAALAATTIALLDGKHGGGWRTAANGTPTAYYRPSAMTIGLFPPPDGTASLTVDAVVTPSSESGGIPLLATDGDSPALPARSHMALVYGAVAKACGGVFAEADGAAQRAQWALAMKAQLVQALREGMVSW